MAVREIVGTNNPYMFNQDAALMTGDWVNPHTGHKFTVRDCIFENGELVVITTAGQRLNYNMVSEYIQDNGSQDAPQQSTHITTPPPVPQPVPAPLLDELLEEDRELIQPRGLTAHDFQVSPAAPVIEDFALIDRLLKKTSLPKLTQFEWEVPEKQIDILVDMFGVEPEDILEYYKSRITPGVIIETMVEAIREAILPKPVTENVETKPSKPKRPTRKQPSK